MKLKTLMLIKAAVCLFLGVPILVAPVFIYSIFGASLNAAGVFPAREYGSALIGTMLITWFAREAVESEARRAILLGLCVYDALGLVVTLIALFAGTLNALGWLIVVIYLFFALGFGYFLARSPKP